ncbi:MAG: RDD family protein [Steroidobacteraceae bacterium]
MNDQSGRRAAAAALLRRLAALGYDCLLLLAILFVGTLALLPLTGGEAIRPAPGTVVYPAYRLYLALLALAYFGLAWTRRGQTLGMMAWGLRLCRADGGAIGWQVATLRFAIGLVLAAAAEFGLRIAFESSGPMRALGGVLCLPLVANFVWIAFDAERRSLQDLLSRMRMLRTRLRA